MKRKRNLYSDIYKLSNIYKIYNEVRKTTKNKNEVINFELNLNYNLLNISNELYNKNYKIGKYKLFLVKEPKYRLIMSEKLKDKIINHLVSRYILDVLDVGLVSQNVATRKGKGGRYAFNLVLKYINKLQLENKNIYVLKIDISKYFYNIDHDILKKKLKDKIKDKDALDLIFKIIDSTNENYINEYIDRVKNREKEFINKCDISNKKDFLKQIDNIPYYVKGKGLPIGNMTMKVKKTNI